MENKILNLIDSEFSVEEAKEVLMNIFVEKIRFHEKKNLSSLVTSGKSDLMSEKRISQIKENIKFLQQIIKDAEGNDQKLYVKADIQIKLT